MTNFIFLNVDERIEVPLFSVSAVKLIFYSSKSVETSQLFATFALVMGLTCYHLLFYIDFIINDFL